MFLCHFKTVIRVKLKAAHRPLLSGRPMAHLAFPLPQSITIKQSTQFSHQPSVRPRTESRCATRAAAHRQPPGRPPVRLLAAGCPLQRCSAPPALTSSGLPVRLCARTLACAADAPQLGVLCFDLEVIKNQIPLSFGTLLCSVKCHFQLKNL